MSASDPVGGGFFFPGGQKDLFAADVGTSRRVLETGVNDHTEDAQRLELVAPRRFDALVSSVAIRKTALGGRHVSKTEVGGTLVPPCPTRVASWTVSCLFPARQLRAGGGGGGVRLARHCSMTFPDGANVSNVRHDVGEAPAWSFRVERPAALCHDR